MDRDAHSGDGSAGAGACDPRQRSPRPAPGGRAPSPTTTRRCSPCTIPRWSTSCARRGRAWSAAALPSDRVVPYIFARSELTSGRVPATPTAVWARPGLFAYDTMTLIGPGTWEAVRAAVDVALTAVDLVASGQPVAYACCRPPGHHVTRSLYGGSCYLNNTAVAASELLERLGGPVAVVDIDAHHGNGTQELFLDRDDVLTASVHVDPGAGWFPHFLGFASENDAANLNLPLAGGHRATRAGSQPSERRRSSPRPRGLSSSRSASTLQAPIPRVRSR